MRTLVFQSLVMVLSLAFGLVALAVARARAGSPDVRRTAWLLAGIGFSFAGTIAVLQNTWAVAAFVAGPESQIWTDYLRWAPAGNHARAYLKIALLATLAILPFAPQVHASRVIRYAVALIVGAAVLGGWAGWQEGTWVQYIHYTAVAITSLGVILATVVALLIHLYRDTMDRLLWLCLCLYVLQIALAALWSTGLVWISVPGSWHPPIWVSDLITSLTYLAMIALASRALLLTRRGVYIPALLEHLEPPPIRTFH